jgi:uncharacterized membrane protein YphA (DoxX/SURF4 family)
MSLNDEERARPLAWSRIALGTLFLLRTTPALVPLHLPFAIGTWPLLGWPREAWHGSALWGLSVPAPLIAAACLLRTLTALSFTLGYRTRPAGLGAGLVGYGLMLQEPFGFNATLHLLFQGTILLAMTDAGGALALRRDPARHVESGKQLIRCFLASIYFWAGFVKLRPDWLDGRTLALFHENGSLSGPVASLLLATEARRELVARSVLLVELSLPCLLLLPMTRRWAPFLALALHAGIELSAQPDLLGWSMAALLLSTLPRKN